MLISVGVQATPLVYLPFRLSSWAYCTQGQGGSFSHQGNQYYGFDFNEGSNYNSSSNPAFGKEVYSPVSGEVVEVRDGVYDFSNNSSSNHNNNWGWGNTVVIKDKGGVYYVRFAHLRFGTTDHLHVGDWVNQYDYIGEIGQTGFSTSPHLHFQIMKSRLGPSVDFTFAEGKLNSYQWIRSALLPNVSMLDNNREVSLSHDFRYFTTYSYGYWQTRSWKNGTAGKDYRRHKVTSSYDSSYFKWLFRVKKSGYYLIYATYPISSLNDPQAKYYLNGNYVRTRDQRKGNLLYKFVTAQYLSANKFNTLMLKGSTKNRYIVADAIVLRKIY